MVKIKRKVEMTPKEFLKHLLEQEETEVELDGYTFDYNEEHYSFDPEIKTNEFINYSLHSDTFTVEIEKEITEETVLPKVLVVFNNGHKDREAYMVEEGRSIKDIIEGNNVCVLDTKTIHLINDDGTHTLIWKDGELVGDE